MSQDVATIELAYEAVRPEIKAFAVLMERQLRKHDEARGERWRESDWLALHDALDEHAQTLFERLLSWEYGPPVDGDKPGRRAHDRKHAPEMIAAVGLGGADVANFAMFLSAIVGALGGDAAQGDPSPASS